MPLIANGNGQMKLHHLPLTPVKASDKKLEIKQSNGGQDESDLSKVANDLLRNQKSTTKMIEKMKMTVKNMKQEKSKAIPTRDYRRPYEMNFNHPSQAEKYSSKNHKRNKFAKNQEMGKKRQDMYRQRIKHKIPKAAESSD